MTYDEAKLLGGIDLWDDPRQERLRYDDLDEAIGYLLDDSFPDPLPATLTVGAFVKESISEAYAKDIANDLVEEQLAHLDENFGDPDGDSTEPWPELVAAAEAFAAELRRKYEVWICKCVHTVEVDVAEWVKANRPDWLGDGVLIIVEAEP